MVDISKQAGAEVRSKVLWAWNRVKYSKKVFNIDTNTTFSENSPVWLLAKPYHKRRKRQPSLGTSQDDEGNCSDEYLAFVADFRSRLWFTYRQNIDTFPGTQLTSDCGWGCMIRSGQMMFGQALLLHCLGRDWVWRPSDPPTERMHRDIVRLFLDQHSAPLSIQNILRMGQGKRPGDWFGPGSVAHLIQMAVLRSQQGMTGGGLLSDLAVYVAQDCSVYKEDVINLCTAHHQPSNSLDITVHDFQIIEPGSLGAGEVMHYSYSEEVTADVEQEASRHTTPSEEGWRAVVIFVPVRLGGERCNPAYVAGLRALLSLPASLGWIGGRPRHSLYFIGFQEDDLIHLDPHILQERVDADAPNFPLDSFHCASPRKISASRMDPSCCLGFYLRTRDEFEAWCEGIADFCTPHAKGTAASYPLFVVCEGKGRDATWVEEQEQQGSMRSELPDTTDSEEFVFL